MPIRHAQRAEVAAPVSRKIKPLAHRTGSDRVAQPYRLAFQFLNQPGGRYSVEPVEDEASALSPDDEAGFRLHVHKTG